MSEEEAKELLKYFILEECKKRCEEDDTCNDCYLDIDQVKAIETVLNMLEEKNEEIEKSEVEYHDLAGEINRLEIELENKDKIIEELAKAFKQDDVRSVDEIIKYFEEKVENG